MSPSLRKAAPKPEYDLLRISLRAYVPTGTKASNYSHKEQGPSEYSLIFDTETTSDAAQKLRFGIYQVRKSQELFEAGIFINSEMFSEWEMGIIRSFAKSNNYRVISVEEFIETVFFGIGYELRATIIGFNLPFDISRLAIYHGNSRGRSMKGGFSLQLSSHKYRPRIQVKHLSSTMSLIRFTTRAGQIPGRGMRRRNLRPLPRPGYFVDVKTLASALTSFRGSLAGLAKVLDTDHRKLETDEHGGQLTDNYLVYARQDVQVTWECYCRLLDKFKAHSFTDALPNRMFSEASLGKAYFREMNIRSWRQVQSNFPDHLIGIIMSTYYGGRAEVHHRRIISQVFYCDFLSMYPTVCTLMGLWKFVISNGLKYRDSTKQTQKLLADISLKGLQKPDTWEQLTTLVQVSPNDDILPIRADYSGEGQDNIGLNYLGPGQALWFTLADCIASKLLTGKSPKIKKAITFNADGVQSELRTVSIAGNCQYRIDPHKDDFFRRIIDQRTQVKRLLKDAPLSEREALNSAQLTLKTLANSMGYGTFFELNVEDLSKPQLRRCYGYGSKAHSIKVSKSEEPGRYFHPLLATLIAGAARLMLATAERLVLDEGLDWAFCDTDSMAIARPEALSDDEFQLRVSRVRTWFERLNPYEMKGEIFKAEDANFSVVSGRPSKSIEPLFCLAVSAKRYVLFNKTSDGGIIIRKASAHGLGHFRAPYNDANAPNSIKAPVVTLSEIGVERWHHDLWHQIIRAALDDHPDQVDLNYHPCLDQPSASRYAATTPPLVEWFKSYNADLEYADRVRPFNFLLAFQVAPCAIHEFPAFEESLSFARNSIRWPKPVAQFSKSSDGAADKCFDRETGQPIPVDILKTYKDALAQYHLRPEHKFLNGDFRENGSTARRYVKPAEIRMIGKESNRWEDRTQSNNSQSSSINYEMQPNSQRQLIRLIRDISKSVGQRELSRRLNVSRKTIGRIISKRCPIERGLAVNLQKRVNSLKAFFDCSEIENSLLIKKLKVEARLVGLTKLSARLKIDPSNLKKILLKKRRLSKNVLSTIYKLGISNRRH